MDEKNQTPSGYDYNAASAPAGPVVISVPTPPVADILAGDLLEFTEEEDPWRR